MTTTVDQELARIGTSLQYASDDVRGQMGEKSVDTDALYGALHHAESAVRTLTLLIRHVAGERVQEQRERADIAKLSIDLINAVIAADEQAIAENDFSGKAGDRAQTERRLRLYREVAAMPIEKRRPMSDEA